MRGFRGNERVSKQRVYRLVMGQDVVLGDREVPVEDLEELPFDPPHITFAKETSADRPVNVSQSRVTSILGGSRQDETDTTGVRCGNGTNLGS